MILQKILPTLFLTVFVTSCTQKNAAPILLKGHNKYYKNSSRKSEDIKYGSGQNFVVIKSGDNLYNIAQAHKTSVRDLIDANNLQPPYILHVGSKLILPRTKYHTVEEGDNLYKISRLYDMNINQLIQINNLEKPYNIIAGTKLKISTSAFKRKAVRKDVEQKKLSKPRKSVMAKLPNKNNKFIWPVAGKVISKFGSKPGGLYNDGINIRAEESTPVKAVEDGLVAYVGNELRGYGNLVILKHSGGWISAYAHLKKTNVVIGQKIKQGSQIALVGSTGNVDFAQLYFGIRKGRNAVNPQDYLN